MTQAGLQIERVSLRVGAFALSDIHFSVAPDEFCVLLGPNGAGKSVLLEAIAGFHRPDSGRILLGGEDITRMPPEKRRIGYVFQHYALFPHLTVAQNVRFALRTRGADGAARERELLERFSLTHLARRRPHDLSGGEKQRVALARAFATEPHLFLFDEPFSAVDEESRARLREEIRGALRGTGIPVVFVTHDRAEARSLADAVVVLQGGQVAQAGSLDDIFLRPVNESVARFVGMENIIAGEIIARDGAGTSVRAGWSQLQVTACPQALAVGDKVLICVRPEDIQVDGDEAGTSGKNRLEGTIAAVRPEGPLVFVEVECGAGRLGVYALQPSWRTPFAAGQPVLVSVPPAALHLLPAPPGRDAS